MANNKLTSTFEAFQAALAAKSKVSPDDAAVDGESKLKDFMAAAREPLTWVEGRELWNNMCKTNNGKLPPLEETWNALLCAETTSETFRGDDEEDILVEVPATPTRTPTTETRPAT